MMACCLLAALILAQIVATVRRWGIFWGVVSPHEWENPETVFENVREVQPHVFFAVPRVWEKMYSTVMITLLLALRPLLSVTRSTAL